MSAVALAKPDHLELASRMCADSWQRMQRTFARRFPEIARAYRDEATQAEGEGPDFSRVIRAIFLPGLQRQLDDLRALGAPRNEQRKVALILGEMRQSIDEGWREPIESARDFMNLFAHFSFLAWKYGLNSCLVYESDFRETDA